MGAFSLPLLPLSHQLCRQLPRQIPTKRSLRALRLLPTPLLYLRHPRHYRTLVAPSLLIKPSQSRFPLRTSPSPRSIASATATATVDTTVDTRGGRMASSSLDQAIAAERGSGRLQHANGTNGTGENGKNGENGVSGAVKTSTTTTTTTSPTTAWDSPGAAEFDFRSDTSTTPNASMLAAMTRTTLLDDMVREDPTTNDLEASCASLLGHPSALLTLSGTMGNQIAARCHLSYPPHAILGDHRAHILTHEAGGTATLSGAISQPVTPSNGVHLTLADVQAAAMVPSDPFDPDGPTVDIHDVPTALISLENTLGGSILPLSDARAITDWARSQNIATHLDGARLWEAVAAQVAHGEHGGSLEAGLRAYGSCFDSVTVCFSKGLGAPLGSVLVGSERLMRRARHVRKSIGGAMRMAGVIAAPATVAVRENFFGGALERGHRLARSVQALWQARGGRCVGPVETNMVWLDLRGAGVDTARFKAAADELGLRVYPGPVTRIVCHYQICDEAVRRLGVVFERVLGEGGEGRGEGGRGGDGALNGVLREKELGNGGRVEERRDTAATVPAASAGAGFKYGGG